MSPFAFVPPAPSPVVSLLAAAPLLATTAALLSERVTTPHPPHWMDPTTTAYLLSLSDHALTALEAAPHNPLPTDAPPSLIHLSNLIAPLRHAFPTRPLPNHTPHGRSPRRTPSRPRPTKRAQVSVTSELLAGALHRASTSVTRIVDIGAGHGHLAAAVANDHGLPVVAVDRNADLLRTATRVHGPKLQTTVEHINPHSRTLRQGDAVLGLHACGALGDALISTSVTVPVQVVVLVSCCLQKVSNDVRIPLSATVLNDATLTRALHVRRQILGATNTPRGYNAHALRARETRRALRLLLEMRGVYTKHGDEVVGLSRHALKTGLAAVANVALAIRGLSLACDHEIAECEMRARSEYRIMRALAIPRAMAAAALEMAVVLDRAACLQEVGFNVSTLRAWPDHISARNLCIVAWR